MNRKWIEHEGAYKLFFRPYDKDIEYAAITQDKDGDWIIVSEPLNIEYDILDAKTVEEAKEEVDVNKLIAEFSDMAGRCSLLTGDVEQEELLIQIIGTIAKVAMGR